jgi:hypothetical protein
VNLDKIRERIQKAVMVAPDVRVAREQLRDDVNEALGQLYVHRRWRFRERVARMFVYPDEEFTDSADIAWDTTDRTITIDAAILPDGWTDVALVDALQGQTAELSWLDDQALTSSPEWVIERAALSGGNLVLHLDPSTPQVAMPADGTVTVRFRRYLLPADVHEVVDIHREDDDGWALRPVPLYEAAKLDRDDSASEPRFYIADPNYFLHRNLAAGPMVSTWYGQYLALDAPIETLAVAVSGAGDLDEGVYEYACAWQYAGQVSPLGPVSRLTVSAADRAVTVSNIDTADAYSLFTFDGRRKLIFRRKDEGRWIYVADLAAATATVTDSGALPPGIAAPIRARDFHGGAGRRAVRLWPRPSEARVYLVRYLCRPRLLEAPGDVPDLPVPELLVHAVARDLLAAGDSPNLSRFHSDRYDELLRLMTNGDNITQGADRQARRSIWGDDASPADIMVGSVRWGG